MKEGISSLRFLHSFVWLIFSFYSTLSPKSSRNDVVCSQIYYTCFWLSLITLCKCTLCKWLLFWFLMEFCVNHIFFPMISFCLSLFSPLFFPPFLLISSSSLLVSNLCGEQGRIAGRISRYHTRFFTPFHSFHWILCFTLESEDWNGALRVFPVQGPHFLLQSDCQ